jgi:SAM-dependent methyltransferase
MAGSIHFDQFANEYDDALGLGLSITGEGKDYFAQGRLKWLARCLDGLGEQPRQIMDYGCGTGSSTRLALNILPVETAIGVDTSERSIEIAREHHATPDLMFRLPHDCGTEHKFDLAYCNGVFHHISVRERARAVEYVFDRLKPGGLFSFWENNPWNPGTRLVMSRIPFDREAITLNFLQARRLLRPCFEIIRTDFLFVFPRQLSGLRRIEPYLSRLPLGGQYQVLCRKPMT